MLFLKHIFRSIKKSPLQPIIILVTLIISVATFITAVKVCINVAKETAIYKNVDNYICDITVKPSERDDLRMLFVEDAEEIIGDNGTVHGEFNLTALVNMNDNSDLIEISASNLISADEFYKFKFVEYGEFTKKNINNSIILSSKTANKYNVKLGETFTVNLLNKRMDFTVQAIADSEGFLKDTEGIINIGAVSDAIAKANPAISSFAGSILPYTVLKIRINDPAKIDEYIDKLAADARFENKNIIKESINVGSADFVHMLSLLVIMICASIIIIISSLVIATSLDLLSKKRIKDSALFMLSGASNGQLNKILYLECFVYSIVAAIIGLLLSIGINKEINVIFDWNTDDIVFRLYDIPIALFASPVIVILTAFIHALRAKKLSISERITENSENKANEASFKPSLIFILLCAIFFTPTFFVLTKYKYIFAIPSLVCFLAFIYTFVPFLVDVVSRTLIRLIEKRKYIPSKTILALKNSKVSFPLKHTARLTTLLVTMIFTVIICLGTLRSETKKLNTLVDCDFVSIGANNKTDALLKNLDEVDDTFRFGLTQNMVTEENTAILGISISDEALAYLNPEIAPERMPINDEVVVTSGIAKLENKKVGDSISFIHETNKYTFTISEIVKSSSNVIFLDSSHIGKQNDLLCIKTDAVKNSEEYQKIANLLETRGAAIIELDTILTPLSSRLLSYANLLSYVVAIAFITTILGIINILFSSHAARKQERDVYYTVGMSKSQIRTTQLIEISYILFISLALVPLLTFLMIMILDTGISAFGIDLFYI